jgi:ferredoxin
MKTCFIVNGKRLETEAFSQLNILAHAQILELDLMSRCGGQAACGTCRVILKSGELSKIREEEKKLLTKIKKEGIRLACQAFPESEEVIVEVPNKESVDLRKL